MGRVHRFRRGVEALGAMLCLGLAALPAAGPARTGADGLSHTRPVPPGAEILPAAEQPGWNAIGRVNIAGYKSRRMCSGTLVAPDRVITAAHCVLGPRGGPAPPGEIVFVAGWRAGDAAAHARAAAVTLHPDFLPAVARGRLPVAADLAMLRLAAPITGVVPIPLAALPDGAPLTILGYRWDRPHILTRHRPCALSERGRDALRTTCRVTFGTSGAPVLVNSPYGPRLVAVVSATGPEGTLAALPEAWPAAQRLSSRPAR